MVDNEWATATKLAKCRVIGQIFSEKKKMLNEHFCLLNLETID